MWGYVVVVVGSQVLTGISNTGTKILSVGTIEGIFALTSTKKKRS